MDVIVTAILIGFIVWVPFKFLSSFLKNYRKFKEDEIIKHVKNNNVFVRVEEVTVSTTNDKMFLIFNAETGKFITQGSIPEIKEYFNTKFKTKSVFLAADDGTIVPVKPADIV